MLTNILSQNQCMFALGKIHGFLATLPKSERERLAEVSAGLENGLENYPPEEVQLILLSHLFVIEQKLNGMHEIPIDHIEMLENIEK